MIDHKLQLDLVPYGSVSFSTHSFTPKVLAPHVHRILSTIAAVPRRYVLFCGAVFRLLLSKHVTRWHQFYLRKRDGTLARQRASFANLLLPYNGGSIWAGLAQSWARQGIPMAAYAEEVRSRYEDAGAHYRGSPVAVMRTDVRLRLVGLHGLGAVTRKREPLQVRSAWSSESKWTR